MYVIESNRGLLQRPYPLDPPTFVITFQSLPRTNESFLVKAPDGAAARETYSPLRYNTLTTLDPLPSFTGHRYSVTQLSAED